MLKILMWGCRKRLSSVQSLKFCQQWNLVEYVCRTWNRKKSMFKTTNAYVHSISYSWYVLICSLCLMSLATIYFSKTDSFAWQRWPPGIQYGENLEPEGWGKKSPLTGGDWFTHTKRKPLLCLVHTILFLNYTSHMTRSVCFWDVVVEDLENSQWYLGRWSKSICFKWVETTTYRLKWTMM